MAVGKLKETYLVAVQWVPESADAIIAELVRAGRHADDLDVNGFDLAVWEGNGNLSVAPGQWIVIVCGQPIIIEADEIGKYLDLSDEQ